MLWLSSVVILATGCSVVLTEAGRRVALEKADAPAGCIEIGSVSGDGSTGGVEGAESAKNQMRNKAAVQHGTYVRLEQLDIQHGSATGTAYRCDAKPPAP